MGRTTLLSLCVLVSACATFPPGARSYPVEDEVSDLPGFGKPPTPQWSGWLDASAAENGTFLHYWFAAHVGGVERAPIVMWLNGGPGAPATIGMMMENGPLLINSTGGLVENPYSWTKWANLLVVEMPAGVGYSYCANSVKGGDCSNTDDSTAAAGRAALENFFDKKFDFLRKNPFYIVGESYAGVYIPTLAKQILDSGAKFNLEGIAVGDPCTDVESQNDSMDSIWYSHKYGFLPDADFDLLWNQCGARHPAALARGKWTAKSEASSFTRTRVKPAEVDDLLLLLANTSTECRLAMRHFLASSSDALSQSWGKAWINDYFLYGAGGAVPNTEMFYFGVWITSDAVKKALHVESAPGGGVFGPSEGWSYTSQYAACNWDAPKGTKSMVDFYREIAPKLRVTRVYNGDSDPCVSYEGTRAAVKKVGFAQLNGGAYRPWFFNASGASLGFLKAKQLDFGPNLALLSAGAQFGGHVVNYEHNLDFVTFHGSGHMVPQFRPRAAEHFLVKLISQLPLSPFHEEDAKLAAMTDDEFNEYLDNWTDKARTFANNQRFLSKQVL